MQAASRVSDESGGRVHPNPQAVLLGPTRCCDRAERTIPPGPQDRSEAAAVQAPSSRRHRPACVRAANQPKRPFSAPELSPAALALRTCDTVPWLLSSPSRSGTQQSEPTARARTHHRYTAPHASPIHVTRRSNRLTSLSRQRDYPPDYTTHDWHIAAHDDRRQTTWDSMRICGSSPSR